MLTLDIMSVVLKVTELIFNYDFTIIWKLRILKNQWNLTNATYPYMRAELLTFSLKSFLPFSPYGSSLQPVVKSLSTYIYCSFKLMKWFPNWAYWLSLYPCLSYMLHCSHQEKIIYINEFSNFSNNWYDNHVEHIDSSAFQPPPTTPFRYPSFYVG